MKNLLNLLFVAVLFSACDREESENVMSQLPPEPGVDVYVVKYKDASYCDYVHVMYLGEKKWGLCPTGGHGCVPQFYSLQEGFYMNDYGLYVRDNVVIVDLLYSDYESGSPRYFMDDEILEKEIFSEIYVIPARLFPTFIDVLFDDCMPISIHYPENVEFIRSMIDDGRIERYRVDLGY